MMQDSVYHQPPETQSKAEENKQCTSGPKQGITSELPDC